MTKKISSDLQSPLAQNILKEYKQLIELQLKIPAKDRNKKNVAGTGGSVSVTDIIAYQIGWGTLLLAWYEAGIRGKKPEMPGEGFTTWDYTGLAHHFYSKYHFDGAQVQLKKFDDLIRQIITIVEKEYETGNLDAIGVWAWCKLASGKEWPLSKWIQVNTVAPYKRATALIKKFIKS